MFGDVAQQDRGDRDAELRRGQLAVQVFERRLYRPRLPLAAPDERLDARAAGRDQGELGGHEERVGQHEGQHRQQAEAERFRAGAGHRGGNIGRVARWRNGPVFWGSGTKQGGQVSAAVPLDVQCTHRAPLRQESRRRLTLVLGITAAVMVAEAVGGWLAHSLALLADAGHMLADVAALGLSLVVTALARRPVTAERTFGLLRLEILAALVNGATLIVIALGIGLEASRRFRSPAEVQGTLLLIIAAVGLAANAVGAAILHRGHDRIASIPGVASVHDLHVWTVTSGVIAMSSHLVVQNPADNQRVLEAVQACLGGMGISHVTVQMERDPTCE